MPRIGANGYATGMLCIHAQTAMHPGSGTALGVVDLPVQRERHTQWPIIPASSLKGVLRDAGREVRKTEPEHNGSRKSANEKDDLLVAAFGPATGDESSAHAGALSLTDARVLAFPVRSLRGVFAWVTCPAVLERLSRDAGLAGIDGFPSIPKPAKEDAACSKDSPLIVQGNHLVLEEFEFQRSGDADAIAGWIASTTLSDSLTADRLKSHLVVLHDDDFTHFVRHATEVVARIGLDYERKTVKTGALFYQEFLSTLR